MKRAMNDEKLAENEVPGLAATFGVSGKDFMNICTDMLRDLGELERFRRHASVHQLCVVAIHLCSAMCNVRMPTSRYGYLHRYALGLAFALITLHDGGWTTHEIYKAIGVTADFHAMDNWMIKGWMPLLSKALLSPACVFNADEHTQSMPLPKRRRTGRK